MVAPVVAAAYVVLAFLLRVLLYVLKKLLNQAAKVTTDIVKKHLAPFLADIGASIAQNLIEFIFSFATEVATDIKKEQRGSTTPKPSGSTKPTAPSRPSNVGAWYEVYTKKPILFKSVICKVCCFSNQIGGATGKAPKKETMADKVISLWGGLRHLRQKAVQVIFALVDIVMEHKCPIKAEVIYDKKTKQPLMVSGANPPRHKFMETPGSGRFGADIIFQLCQIHQTKVTILEHDNDISLEKSLVADVIELMMYFQHDCMAHAHTKTKKRLKNHAS